MSTNHVSKLYNTVVTDVINNVKEAFLDEGVDEQVLQELKQLWESKLASSKALEPPTVEPDVSFATSHGVPVMMPQPIPSAAQQNPVMPQRPPVQPVSQFQPTGAAAPPPAAAAQPQAIAVPPGIFSQQITTLNTGGQMQNITVQQTGSGQYITVAGISPQQLPQFQQQLQLQHQQHQQRQMASQAIRQQGQPIRLPQQHPPQQPKLIPGSALLRPQATQPGQPSKGQTVQGMIQLDGNGETSSSEDEDLYDDDKEDDAKEEENEEEGEGEEEEPLNSEDDVSEEDPTELFDSENVVVCQYDKINRNKNKWKFHLKDGIMNLNGRDFVFQKAIGDSEW